MVYTFNKDYETQIRVSTPDGKGTGTKQVKIQKGTMVDGGDNSSDLISIKHDGMELNVDATYLDSIATKQAPVEPVVSAPVVSSKKVSGKYSTAQKVVFASVLLVGAYFGLTYFKVLKPIKFLA